MTLYKGKRLYTLTDVARALNVTTKSVWYRVYENKLYPRPRQLWSGKPRRYWSEEQYAEILSGTYDVK